MESPYNSPVPPRRAEISFDSISEAWKYLQPNLGPWIGATLVYALITAALSVLQTRLSPPDANGIPQLGAAYWLTTLVSFVVGQFLIGGLIRMAIATVRTGRADFGLVFSAFDVLPALIGAGILTTIASFFGFLLCIVPGLLLLGLFLFVTPLIVDQRKGALDAMSTSFNTLKPHMWMALLYLLVIGLLAGAGVLACGVGVLVTLPLALLAIAVTYRDFFLGGAAPSEGPFVPTAPIADPRG
ncbi:MAG: hypothetical protein KY445_02555 [Armatimonadetes bacterium]|nr:hypothetical protein [Armatimonadota bacterium]